MGNFPIATGSSSAMRMAREASIASIVRRLFQRSTKTPASGPISSVGTEVASRTPLTATGAQVCPLAMTAAIQSTSVVLKTKSPTLEIDCPLQSRAKLRLMRKPGFLFADVGDAAVSMRFLRLVVAVPTISGAGLRLAASASFPGREPPCAKAVILLTAALAVPQFTRRLPIPQEALLSSSQELLRLRLADR